MGKTKQKGFSVLTIVILLLVVTVVGCAAWYILQRSNERSTVSHKTVRDLRIERTSSGGFTGRGDGKNFSIYNSQVHFGNTVTALSPSQTAAIVDKIGQANFFKLSAAYTCGSCADGFISTLRITLNGSSHTVSIEDGSDAPADLLDLQKYLLNLLPSKSDPDCPSENLCYD